MTSLIQTIKSLLSQKEPLPPGMLSYQSPQEDENQYRLHLRIEKDGTGLLVINASTILHLNPTATEFAYYMMQGTDADTIALTVAQRYQVDQAQARQDYDDFVEKIETLITTPDLDPVTFLDIERQEPYTGENSAPYRLDCALTYEVGKESHRDHAPVERVDRELTTAEWVTIFDKAFTNGIPHLLFTGGEPTLREDLPDLIHEAENIGLVTGLLTDGFKLAEDAYRNALLVNGLDHLVMVFDPDNPKVWQILEKILAEDLFTTVHLTLKEGEDLHPMIARLSEMGAQALSLSAANKNLTESLQDLRDFAAVQQLELIWNLPVPYSRINPVSMELENTEDQAPPEGAGNAWLYVEPDGDVLPAQGLYDQIMGNMLTDPWEEIWGKR